MALVVGNASSAKGKRPVIKPKPKAAPKPSYTVGGRPAAAPGGARYDAVKKSQPKPAPKPAPKSSKASISQLIDSYKKPGTGVGTPVNKNPINPVTGSTTGRQPARPAPKAAPKAAPKPPVGGGAKAPIVAGSGIAPTVKPLVAGGGSPKPANPAAATAAKKNETAANRMQQFLDEAKKSISAQDLPGLNELQRQLDSIRDIYGKQKGETEARGKRMEGDLAELFGRLGNFTRNIKSQTDSEFQALQAQAGQNTTALQQQLAQTFGNAKSGTEAELARLGMSGQAPNATADITRDSAWLQGLAGADGAHTKNAFGLQQGGFDQLMGMAMGNAATEGATQIGQAKRQTAQTLADLLFELNQGTRQVEGQRGDIIATQGQRASELAMALEDRDYSRTAEQAATEFANKIALERLGMDKEAHALGMQAPAQQGPSLLDTLEVAKKKLEIQKLAGSLGSGSKGGMPGTYQTTYGGLVQ